MINKTTLLGVISRHGFSKRLIILILTLPILTSCLAVNKEGGISVGRQGSPAWIKTSTEQEVNNFFDKKPIYELCMIWSERYKVNSPARIVRTEIAKSLERRSMNPMKCDNPESDNEKRRNDALKARPIVNNSNNNHKQRLKNQELKNSLDDMQDKLEAVCRASGKILIGKQCL